MAFFDIFRTAPTQATPQQLPDEATKMDDVLLTSLLAGNTITRDQAMMIPAVSSNVDRISSTFALLPVKLYRKEAADGKIRVVEVDDPRVELLNDDTKDTLDGFQFKKALCEDYLLGKGGYAFINRVNNSVKSVNYVDERQVYILHNVDPIFKSYDIVVGSEKYSPYQFIKLLRRTKNGWDGTGIVAEVSSALQAAYKTLLYQLQLVGRGGNKKGFLRAKRKLGQAEIDALKKAWYNLYSNSSENVVVLNDGLEFQESSNTSVEMQLNQSKSNLNREIDAIFHMDPDPEKFIRNAILPIGTAFKTALNRDFLLEKEKGTYFWDIDYSETLKASLRERYEAYKIGKQAGFLSINEVRKRENLEEIDGLDVIDLGLGSTLFDMKTGDIYIPNTDTHADQNEEGGKEDGE